MELVGNLVGESFSLIRFFWDRFEALVGLIAAFMIAFAPVTIFGGVALFAFLMGEWNVAMLAGLGFAITSPTAVWLAKMSERALKDYRRDSDDSVRTPFALILASKVPKLPLIVRIPLAIWWLTHFVAGTLLVECADWLVQEQVFMLAQFDGIPGVIYAYLFYFAANIFLILAVTTLVGSNKVAKRVWRKRFVYDFVFTLPLIAKLFF